MRSASGSTPSSISNSWMLSEPVLALGERLAGLVPDPLDRVMLLNTGSEANEVALKLAKMHTGRFEIVGLTRGFHGLLAGIASVNFSMAHSGYGPLLPGSFALPAPYAYRCPVRHCDGACDCTCLETGFDLIDQSTRRFPLRRRRRAGPVGGRDHRPSGRLLHAPARAV